MWLLKTNLGDRASRLFAEILLEELFAGSIILPPLPRTDASTDRLLVLQYVEPTTSSLAESIDATRFVRR